MPVLRCLQCHQHLWCVYRLRQILFQSASEYTKRRETTSRWKTRLIICFHICHRGNGAHKKGTERYEGSSQKKKDQDGSSLKDTSVYLQRARWQLKKKDAQYCFKHITHVHTTIRNKTRNNIPPDKHPPIAISIKIEYISMHCTWYHVPLLLNHATQM